MCWRDNWNEIYEFPSSPGLIIPAMFSGVAMSTVQMNLLVLSCPSLSYRPGSSFKASTLALAERYHSL